MEITLFVLHTRSQESMSKIEMIESLTKQINEVLAERNAWKKAAEKNEQAVIERNGILIDMLNAALDDLREYTRCKTCKYLDGGNCIQGKVCDTKSEWKWRGLKQQ